MSALKTNRYAKAAPGNNPYPSWSEVADTVGLQARIVAQDQQARKEAKLWRDLADEPRTGGPIGSHTKEA